MKIQITKNQKIQLLKSIKTGIFDSDEIFPELKYTLDNVIILNDEGQEVLRLKHDENENSDK